MVAIFSTSKKRKFRGIRTLICQCCGWGFSPKARGTNRDQSKNSDYCLKCFKNGEFTNPHLTIRDMEKKLLTMARHNDELCIEEAHMIINRLPDLKRWRMTRIL